MQLRTALFSVALTACAAGPDKDTDSDAGSADDTDVIDTETDVADETDETDAAVETDETDAPLDTDETDVPVDSDTDVVPVDLDGDSYTSDVDCNDDDDTIHPGAGELCDLADRDCDGDPVAGATDLTSWFIDDDGDGFGGRTVVACDAPEGVAGNLDDCDDDDAALAPGLAERCDGQRNDCDGGLWEPALEDGIVTFTGVDGAVSDVTPLFQGTLALRDGTYSVCPGTWHVRLTSTGVAVTVRGVGDEADVVIDGDGGGRVVTVDGGAFTADNLSLRGGSTPGAGGVLSSDLADVVLRGVYAEAGEAQDGGLIAVSRGKLDLYDTRLGYGEATRSGGALFAREAVVYAEDAKFSDSSATTEGGGLALVDSDTLLENVFVMNNVAGDGGGIYVSGGALTVASGDISGNHATFSGGGVMALDADTVTLSSVALLDNVASTGGGVAAWDVADLEFDEVSASRNESTGNGRGGGGAFLDDCVTSITGSAFWENVAVMSGGAVLTWGGSLVALDSDFGDSRALSGAGLSLGDTQTSITNGTVTGNTASGIGGGIVASGGGFTMQNVVVQSNVSGEGGGGLYLAWLDGTITDGSILDNEAEDGGGLYVGAATIGLTDVDLARNQATRDGGGLHVVAGNERPSSVTLLAGTRVRSNSAPNGGGAFVREDSTLTCGSDLVGQDPGITGNRSPASGDAPGVMLETGFATARLVATSCDFGVTATASDNTDVAEVALGRDVLAGGTIYTYDDDQTFTCDGDQGCGP